MTPFLKTLQKSSVGLFDSDTNKSLKAYKAIDITDMCTDCEQLIIKYCKAKRGLIAQLSNLYEKEKDLGIQVHYFLNEKSAKTLSEDEVFKRMAKNCGCDAWELALTIYLNK